MFIQKIFHVHQNLEETKASLAGIHRYRRHLDGVQKAVITADGVAQFDCMLPHALHTHCVLVGLPTPDSNEVLFRSTAGNVNISGLVEFFPIRDNLTEVQITIDYGFKSVMHSIVDGVTSAMEHFINHQLRRIQAHLDGMPAHAARTETTTRPMAHIPALAR
jgi:hypothetical protein